MKTPAELFSLKGKVAVVIGGTDTTSLDERGLTTTRAHLLGFIFQFHHLLPAFTAVENVMLAGEYAGLGTRRARERAIARLTTVGLAERPLPRLGLAVRSRIG